MNRVRLYPAPVQDTLFLVAREMLGYKVQILNEKGRTVRRVEDDQPKRFFVLSDLPEGKYYFRIYARGESWAETLTFNIARD